jgi:hypothetical protein
MSEVKLTPKWPPNEDQIKTIASSALNHSHDKDVSVLVYWLNDPNLMIFDPIHSCLAKTAYIVKKYEHNERSVLVRVGKED